MRLLPEQKTAPDVRYLDLSGLDTRAYPEHDSISYGDPSTWELKCVV